MTNATITTQDIVNKLVDILKEEGQLFLSNIPSRLDPIDYKLYSNGKGLKAWLAGFPEFTISENGLALLLTGGSPDPAPAVNNSASISEVRCMHAFSYMNYWTQNLKQLKLLGDFSDTKADVLRDHMGHVLMRSLLLGEMEYDGTDPLQPRLVLNTELLMPDNHPVYAVFGQNPANTDGTKQYWSLKGFCSDSESDRSELALWLRSRFGSAMPFDYTDLSSQIEKISAQADTVKAAIAAFLASMDAEVCPALEDGCRLSQKIAEYEKQWESLGAILESFPTLSTGGSLSLSELRSSASKESFRTNLLQQALDRFGTLAEGMQRYFAENHWEADGVCTPRQDHEDLCKFYTSTLTDPNLTQFQEALEIYRRFRAAISADEANEEYYDNLHAAISHFTELPSNLRLASRLLFDIPQEERAFLDDLDTISQILNQYLTSAPADAQESSISLPDTSPELLQLALNADNTYLINWPLYLKAALPQEPELQKLIARNTDPAWELSCHAAACRLLEAGHRELAERYLILGLQHEGAQCAPDLLKLYREDGAENQFALIWNRYNQEITFSPQDESFWFGSLCQRSPQEALELTQAEIHMQYLPAYLSNLITAAESLGDTVLADTLRARLEQFSAGTEVNPLEDALIRDDRKAIADLVQSAQLAELGYTEKQIRTIQDLSEAGDYPTGNTPYEIGCRLYAFQGNRNSLAEQWLWKGVSRQNRGNYTDLLLLLTNEQRWEEAIRLYENHAESQSRFENCRRLYLIARYYHSAAQAQPAFRENLQDALSIMNLMASVRDRFVLTAQEPGNDFYALLLKLHNAVSNPYLWSVVCEDRSLRDRVFDQTQLSALGLNVSAISEVYRSGAYPHGRDATSVARRLYALAGNLAAAAETAALLAGEETAARNLLWTIYNNEQNEAALFQLLTDDENLRQEHYAQYLGLLYSRGEFRAFLELVDQRLDLSDLLVVQRATAELTIGKPLTDHPDVCAGVAAASSPETCLELLRAAAEAEEYALVTDIICKCFDRWLLEHPQHLRDLVTCCGSFQHPEALQQTALEESIPTLAVYIQNVLGVGSVPEQAAQLYEHLQAELRSDDLRHQLQCLQKLQRLYPEQAAQLSVQAATVSIRAALSSQEDTQQTVPERLEAVIGSLGKSAGVFDTLLQLLEGSEYCKDYRVYTAIRNYAKQAGRLTDALLFFHRASRPGGAESKAHFRDFLVKSYLSALMESRFPEQILSDAEALCFQSLKQSGSPQAALAIAMMEQLMGRPVYANAVLDHLANITGSRSDFAKTVLATLNTDEIPSALALPDPLPTLLELFEQVINGENEENILRFLQFCQAFATGDTGSFQELRNLRADQSLSEEQSLLALNLLCSNPEKDEYWELCAHIPFDVEDAGQASFLHLYCRKNPGRWKEYVQLCEALSSAPERLPAALANWAATTDPHAHDCRQYIEEKLEKYPTYLKELNDSQSLCRMTTNLCGHLKGVGLNMIHAQLRAVSLIAVSTGLPECLNLLQAELGYLLFGSKSDLGVVVLSRLLLAERFEEAHAWLNNLSSSLAVSKYQALIDELSTYSAEQLRDWAKDPSGKTFLALILPDGNQPNIKQVANITAQALLNGTEKETAAALVQVMQIFPGDYVTTYELLELCKTGFEGSIPLMHSCLISLARISKADDITRKTEDRLPKSHFTALAILNQLIIYHQQMDTVDSGWDFSRSTSQNLDKLGIFTRFHGQIAEVEKKVYDSLDNLPEEISALRAQAWLANITGNWTEYLQRVYQAGQLPQDVFFPEDNVDCIGFVSSVLRLLQQTPPAQVPALEKWLSDLSDSDGLSELSTYQKKQIACGVELYQDPNFTRFLETAPVSADRLLRFPIENGRLFDELLDQLLPSVLAMDPPLIKALCHVLCAMGSRYTMYVVFSLAEEYFSKEQDDIAWALYAALFFTSKSYPVSHTYSVRYAFGENTSKAYKSYSFNTEEYQSKMRISGTFYGDADCLKKLADPELSPWSTINLILCMAVKRADEIWRLESFMAPETVEYAEQVRMVLSNRISDEEKINLLYGTFLTPLHRYYLALMLRYPYSDKNPAKPYYLNSIESAKTVASLLSDWYRMLSQKEQKKRNHAILYKGVSLGDININIEMQKTASVWKKTPTTAATQENYTYQAPDYVSHLTPVESDPKALMELRMQYSRLNNVFRGNFADKAQLSAQIYCHTLGSGEGAAACYRALLRYSVDQFYALVSDGTPSSRQEAFQLLIALMETESGGVSSGPEYEALVDMVNALGAAGLIRSYGQIRQLAEQYASHTAAFVKLKNLLQDKVVSQNMGIIYEVLGKLADNYALFGSSDPDKLLAALNEADARISAMSTAGATSVKNQLQRMIRSEITALSRRAILDIQLLNAETQPRTGNLTGMIVNRGTVMAESLTLQAFYGTSNSEQYTLRQLPPNEKAIFEIPYECAADQALLTGRLDLVGQSGNAMVSAQYEFLLELGITSGDDLAFNTYQTDRPRFTYDPQTKSVQSNNFFGRSAETARMRELVAGDNFADFHSAVVYGVRRTGKTSLLEYFRRYVLGTHPECLCIRIDVQETDETIHSVFVKCVLQEPSVVEALENCSDRDVFTEKWKKITAAEEDMDPKLITVFFRELYQLTGKGMILIVDEIDRLFKRMMDDHQEQLLNDLLSKISGLLDNDDRKEYLQLVICGSNWLMYYAKVGFDMQQVFHRFGDYKISVGRLPKDDVMDLLNSAKVNYAPGAKDMIWEYTGGLVWFVKLLANAAIRRAKSANRSWIYPADVFFSLPDVVTDLNCYQFYEGCLSGSLERQMIDAMQSIAYRKDIYMSMDTICELVDKNPQEVEQALSSLILFEIAERSPVNPDTIRFCLDIYRRYFRTVQSAYKHIPEEVIVFEPKNTTGAAVTYTAISEAYSDDEEI